MRRRLAAVSQVSDMVSVYLSSLESVEEVSVFQVLIKLLCLHVN